MSQVKDRASHFFSHFPHNASSSLLLFPLSFKDGFLVAIVCSEIKKKNAVRKVRLLFVYNMEKKEGPGGKPPSKSKEAGNMVNISQEDPTVVTNCDSQ